MLNEKQRLIEDFFQLVQQRLLLSSNYFLLPSKQSISNDAGQTKRVWILNR